MLMKSCTCQVLAAVNVGGACRQHPHKTRNCQAAQNMAAAQALLHSCISQDCSQRLQQSGHDLALLSCRAAAAEFTSKAAAALTQLQGQGSTATSWAKRNCQGKRTKLLQVPHTCRAAAQLRRETPSCAAPRPTNCQSLLLPTIIGGQNKDEVCSTSWLNTLGKPRGKTHAALQLTAHILPWGLRTVGTGRPRLARSLSICLKHKPRAMHA